MTLPNNRRIFDMGRGYSTTSPVFFFGPSAPNVLHWSGAGRPPAWVAPQVDETSRSMARWIDRLADEEIKLHLVLGLPDWLCERLTPEQRMRLVLLADRAATEPVTTDEVHAIIGPMPPEPPRMLTPPVDRPTEQTLVDLARQGREENFRFLARASGVPDGELDPLWQGTLARLRKAPA